MVRKVKMLLFTVTSVFRCRLSSMCACLWPSKGTVDGNVGEGRRQNFQMQRCHNVRYTISAVERASKQFEGATKEIREFV
jgi:hypothetical protein